MQRKTPKYNFNVGQLEIVKYLDCSFSYAKLEKLRACLSLIQPQGEMLHLPISTSKREPSIYSVFYLSDLEAYYSTHTYHSQRKKEGSAIYFEFSGNPMPPSLRQLVAHKAAGIT